MTTLWHSSIFSLDSFPFTAKENSVSWLGNGCASEVQALASEVVGLASMGSVELRLGARKSSNTAGALYHAEINALT